MSDQPRILVTGAGGFICHHLVSFLKARGAWVRGVDVKLPEYAASSADEFELLDLRRWDDCLRATQGVDEVYGWEKLMTERLCRHYGDEYGIQTRIARFHNIFGPLGTWRGGREKAPAAICRKVAEAKLTHASVIDVWGDGEQTRGFCYMDDCLEVCIG